MLPIPTALSVALAGAILLAAPPAFAQNAAEPRPSVDEDGAVLIHVDGQDYLVTVYADYLLGAQSEMYPPINELVDDCEDEECRWWDPWCWFPICHDEPGGGGGGGGGGDIQSCYCGPSVPNVVCYAWRDCSDAMCCGTDAGDPPEDPETDEDRCLEMGGYWNGSECCGCSSCACGT